MDNIQLDFLVLIGPSGAGKSFIGKTAAASFDQFEFVDGEKYLIQKYGSVNDFIKVKTQALKDLYHYIEELAKKTDKTIIFEGIGLSDQSFIDYFQQTYHTLLIEVISSKELCISQVSTRQKGLNFRNENEYTEHFYDYWHQKIRPTLSFDLSIQNDHAAIEDIKKFFTNFLIKNP